MFLYPEDIDQRLNWPLGQAQRMARRGQLPHIILPDGALRFEWDAVESLVRRVSPPVKSEAAPNE